MDLSRLWDGAGDLDEEGGGVDVGQRRDKRQYTYKRKGITFTSTTKDNRTLRSMKVTERRKGSRQSMHSAGRAIEDEDLDTVVENDENEDSVFETKTSSTSKLSDIQKKSRMRREKLNEYLDQKKKLEDMKRKMAKPAFKVGIVHHPVAPIISVDVKPNLFSTTLNTSKATPRFDKSKSSNHKIRRTKSDLTGDRSKAFVFSAKDITKDLSTKLTSVVEDQIPTKSLPKEELSGQTKLSARDIHKSLSVVPVSKVEDKLPKVQNHDPYLATITEDVHEENVHEEVNEEDVHEEDVPEEDVYEEDVHEEDVHEEDVHEEDVHEDVYEDVHEVCNIKPEAVLDQLPNLHTQETKKNYETSEIMEPPSAQFDHLALTGSCSTKSIIGLSKSRESFGWFVKKAMSDKRSFAHTELYHWLLKMFTEADINKEGLVRKASFTKLFDMAVSIPKMYGYAPVESEFYKSDDEKEQAMENMFNSMDIMDIGVIPFNEWYQFSKKHIFAKTATMYSHPLLDAGDAQQFMRFIKDALVPGSTENTELYRFLVEVFAEHDDGKDGVVTVKEFTTMLNEVLKIPKKVSIVHPAMIQVEDDEVKREEYLETLFKTNSTQNRMSLDEWLKLAIKDVYKNM